MPPDRGASVPLFASALDLYANRTDPDAAALRRTAGVRHRCDGHVNPAAAGRIQAHRVKAPVNRSVAAGGIRTQGIRATRRQRAAPHTGSMPCALSDRSRTVRGHAVATGPHLQCAGVRTHCRPHLQCGHALATRGNHVRRLRDVTMACGALSASTRNPRRADGGSPPKHLAGREAARVPGNEKAPLARGFRRGSIALRLTRYPGNSAAFRSGWGGAACAAPSLRSGGCARG